MKDHVEVTEMAKDLTGQERLVHAESFHTGWDDFFFAICDVVKKKSKDPSSQFGSVICDKQCRVLGVGFNGFPRGVRDTPERYTDRDVKLLLCEHSERNAIYSAAAIGIPLKGTVMYINGFPCADCARAVVQSGIQFLHCIMPDPEFEARWKPSLDAARIILAEGKVRLFEHQR